MAVILLRVLIVLIIFGCFIWISYKRKLNGKPAFSCAAVGILVGISAIFAWYLTDLIPFPTEEVRITALGEKNEAAKNDELYLTGIYVDGEQVELKTATDEHWFWQGDWYVWRNDSDTRRPKELSDSFVLKIPAGNERYIEFFTNQHKGKVEIVFAGNSTIFDCYSENDNRISAYIAASRSFLIPIYYAISFAIFITIMVLSILICNTILQWNVKYNNCLVKYIVAHQNVLIYIGLAIVMQSAMLYYHQFNPLVWRDDWLNISIVLEDSMRDVVYWNLIQRDATPPFFNILAYYWIRIIPNTIQSLYLLPQIFLCVSVIIMGRCGEYLFGKWGGILSAAFTASSAALILSMGYEFRSYSLYFLFSSLSILFFLKSMSSNHCGVKLQVCKSLSYIGLLYSHYFGIMYVGILFLADVYSQFGLKRTAAKDVKRIVKVLAPYFLSICIFFVWVINTFVYRKSVLGQAVLDSWKFKPIFLDIISTFEYFFSNYTITKVLFLISVILLLNEIVGHSNNKKDKFISILLFSITIVPVIFIFLLKDEYPLFTQRYFGASVPSAILFVVYGLNSLSKRYMEFSKNSRSYINNIASMLLILVLFYNMHLSLVDVLRKGNNSNIVDGNIRPSENYIQVVDTLKDLGDINYQSTSVCVVRQSGAGGGQRAFEFFLETDKTKGINVISNGEMEKYDDYDVLYMITYHNKKTFDTIVKKDSTLNENFTYDKSYCNGAIHRYVRKT